MIKSGKSEAYSLLQFQISVKCVPRMEVIHRIGQLPHPRGKMTRLIGYIVISNYYKHYMLSLLLVT